MKTIDGLLKSWAPEGRVYFDGKDMPALPGAETIRRGVASMPQKKNVCEEFTVEKNLLTSAAIYPKMAAKERVQGVYETLPVLKIMRRRTPFNMSGGERQLLAFGKR